MEMVGWFTPLTACCTLATLISRQCARWDKQTNKNKPSPRGSYHGLFGDVHQVFNIVILMLLKGREEHVQHLLLVCSCSFAFFLLLFLIIQLGRKKKTIKKWLLIPANTLVRDIEAPQRPGTRRRQNIRDTDRAVRYAMFVSMTTNRSSAIIYGELAMSSLYDFCSKE